MAQRLTDKTELTSITNIDNSLSYIVDVNDITSGALGTGKKIKQSTLKGFYSPDATTTNKGIVELLTEEEMNAVTDNERSLTAYLLNRFIAIQDYASTTSVTGLTTVVNPGNSLNLITLLNGVTEGLRKESFFNLRDTSNNIINWIVTGYKSV